MEQTEEMQVQTPEEEPAAPAPEPKGSLFNDIVDILETMLVSVFIILLLFSYVMRPVTVEGTSMVPTLDNADKLVMFRLFYQPTQGDIVVVNNYEGHILDISGNVQNSGYSLNECLIKRVIAVGGQELDVRASEGAVYVDGERLYEPYIAELTTTDDRAFTYPITIPEGYVFCMGDNRNHSTDSRNASVGLIKTEDVLGKAYFRYSGSALGFVG